MVYLWFTVVDWYGGKCIYYLGVMLWGLVISIFLVGRREGGGGSRMQRFRGCISMDCMDKYSGR